MLAWRMRTSHPLRVKLMFPTLFSKQLISPYPYGFAMQKDGSREPDLNETNWLIACLKEIGIPIVTLTIANPYYEPYYGRPFDIPIIGAPDAPEHPLQGVARFIDIVGKVQKANPDLPVIGTGYTWLRQYLPYAAAATLKLGKAAMIGLGRGAFAYPDMLMRITVITMITAHDHDVPDDHSARSYVHSVYTGNVHRSVACT